MLKKVVIHHFRSCTDLTIDDLGPSTVLVGRNGAGKTNILRAILWAAETATGRNTRKLLTDGVANRVTLEFDLNNNCYRYSLSLGLPGLQSSSPPASRMLALSEEIEIKSDSAEWTELARRDGSIAKSFQGRDFKIARISPLLPFLMVNLPQDDPGVPGLREIEDFLRSIRYYPFDEKMQTREYAGFVASQTYQEWLLDPESVSEVHDPAMMKLLHLCLTDPSTFEDVGDLLGSESGLGIIEEINIRAFHHNSRESVPLEDQSADSYFIEFRTSPEIGDPGRLFPFESLSHGTRRIIQILVAMIFDKSSVMLIEHPEDGIHRMMAEKVFSLLRTYTDPSQILVSTHSTTIFDMLRPEETRLVWMEDGVTQARALSREETEEARDYIQELGTFSDYFKHHVES